MSPDLRALADAHPDLDPDELRELLDDAIDGLNALSILATGRSPEGLLGYDADLLVRRRRLARGLPVCAGVGWCDTPPEEDGWCWQCRLDDLARRAHVVRT